jgi:hypothetical protein
VVADHDPDEVPGEGGEPAPARTDAKSAFDHVTISAPEPDADAPAGADADTAADAPARHYPPRSARNRKALAFKAKGERRQQKHQRGQGWR